jgi:hypothetical protein
MDVIINGVSYPFGPIKAGVGRKLKEKYPDTGDFNVALIAESLKAGGAAYATPQWVDENVDYFLDGIFNQFLTAALEANGFKVEKPKVGEEQPPVEAAV